MERLVKVLKQEAIANPKKAAILGLLLIVAIVFWAPLVWGWVKPDATAKEKPAKETEVSTVSATTEKPVKNATAEQTRTGASASTDWRTVADWIESDPRMTVAKELPHRKHPFDRVELPATSQNTKKVGGKGAKKDEKGLPVELDPEGLGVKLSSTVVGPNRRAALINGKSYAQNDVVTVNQQGEKIEFELIKVFDDRVILRRADKQYSLALPKPKLSDRLEIKPWRGQQR